MVDLLFGDHLQPVSSAWLRANAYGTNRGEAVDLFAGLGGLSAAFFLAGGNVTCSANHWNKSVMAHGINFPQTEHLIGDLSILHPTGLPGVGGDILLAAPECRKYSQASNWREAAAELSPYDPKREGERSRATMWCPQRLAAYRGYEYIILENVVEVATRWNQFGNWVKEWRKLGYIPEVLSINGAFFGIGQSRDRLAFIIRRKGAPRPNLDFRPLCACRECGIKVYGVQTWKPGAVRNAGPLGPVGKYGKQGQYWFRCPHCASIATPFIVPAITAIDRSIPAERIGDRKRPLKPQTMDRIIQGVRNLGTVGQLVVTDNREGKKTRSVDEPSFTQTTRQELGYIDPSTTEQHRLVMLRNNGRDTDPAAEPAASVCASGNHHGLIGTGDQDLAIGPQQRGAVMRPASSEPSATVTAANNTVVVGANRTHNVPRDAERAVSPPVMTGDSLFKVDAPPTPDMIVQTAGHNHARGDYARAWSAWAIHPTVDTTFGKGVFQAPGAALLSPNQNTPPRDANQEPAFAQVSTTRAAVVQPPDEVLVTYYGSNMPVVDPRREPAGTQTTHDRHGLLCPAGGTWQDRAIDMSLEPAYTHGTRDSFAAVDAPKAQEIDINDCTFRMLVAHEAQALMDLAVRPDGSQWQALGLEENGVKITHRDAVRLAGNGVIQTAYANVIDRVFQAREGTLMAPEDESRQWFTEDDLPLTQRA